MGERQFSTGRISKIDIKSFADYETLRIRKRAYKYGAA
ncbi:hypothetical protein OHAE_3921 [Ochrobactrum soli]|uniref:Uncharacterized protein n=1 Tax=Ochrobactrum soli TaxID=2448455 RepID=A0A2P9HIS4_9HYPH|nr:hypothetical protein OHAE_3921 [[Ochrobactrum] soli]